VSAEPDAGAPGEHSQQDERAVHVYAAHRAAREAERGRRDERLDLDQQRARPLQRGHDDAARGRAALLEKHLGGVAHLGEAGLAHLEHTDLVGGAEAVLRRAQDAKGVETVALQVQHRVDHVLEHARAGDRALLRDVPDQEDRNVFRLGGLQ
jgi:hypothetical protein